MPRQGFTDANRSLERGISILRAFRPGVSELGNAELAERTGLPKATVSRLTQTLLGTGMLERDPLRRTYRLAAAVLGLAHAMRLSSPILSAIAPLMRQEAARRRVNIGLATADGDMMVYLESFRYSAPSSLRTIVSGHSIPVALTSLGRAYLWALPPERRVDELRQIAQRRARTWPQLRLDIQRSFDEIDASGYCTVRWQPGVAAVAAPIVVRGLAPHSLNISISSSEPLSKLRRMLGPWLLDLRKRCLEEIDERLLSAEP